MQFIYNDSFDKEEYYCYYSDIDKQDLYYIKKKEFQTEAKSKIDAISDKSCHKSIAQLTLGTYCIPTYQRGYRWNEQNVTQLLEDVFEGKKIEDMNKELLNEIKNESDSDRFELLKNHVAYPGKFNRLKCRNEHRYCIQPLVVMRKNRFNLYDVVDGQQRLTTIAIILAALGYCGVKLKDSEKVSIRYESRENSEKLLAYLFSKDLNQMTLEEVEINFLKNGIDNNIDFEHIFNSFRIAVEFFRDCEKNFNSVFSKDYVIEYYQYLLYVLLHCTEFVWYVADKDTFVEQMDERKIFANFNTGKLALTNSELIKAIFMNPIHFDAVKNTQSIKDRQIVIAEKWDFIESQLHNPDFWAFVPHPNQYGNAITEEKYQDTRIDVIFDFLVMKNWMLKNHKSAAEYIREKRTCFTDDYYTFLEIEAWINEKLESSERTKREIMDECWKQTREIFTSIREFYEDDRKNFSHSSKLYNLIGFYTYAKNVCKEDGTFYSSPKNNHVVYSVGDTTYLEVYSVFAHLSEIPRDRREKEIKEKIKNLVFGSSNSVSNVLKNIRYKGEYQDKIAIILLLYNIALLNQSGGIGNRFDFFAFSNQTWQREHIFAQSENYLKDSKRVLERKAALQALAGDSEIDNSIIYYKQHSYLQYVNFRNGKEESYCPVEEGEELTEETIQQALGNGSYCKEYLQALHTIQDAKKQLRILEWILKAKEILSFERSGKENRNIAFLEKIFDYFSDNTEFYSNLDISSVIDSSLNGESFLDLNSIEQYLQKELKMNTHEILKKYLGDLQGQQFIHYELEEKTEGEKDSIRNVLKKAIKRKFVRQIKQIFWLTSEERRQLQQLFFDNAPQEEMIQAYEKLYFNYKEKTKNGKIDYQDMEIEETAKKQKTFSIEEIKNNLYLTDTLDFVLEAINQNCITMQKKLDEFFEKEYTGLLSDNSLGNFTLLSGSINSTIGNKSYSEKSDLIYKSYKKGSFIPLGTMFVFTDLYTKSVNSARQWLPISRLSYFKDIVNTLSSFLTTEEK